MAERKRKRNTRTSATRLVTSGTTVRIENPASSRKPKKRTSKVVVQEIHPVDGFVGFLREYAIVGLSIGFIIGNQMSTLVKVLVSNFIDPLTQLLFGTALSQRTFTLHLHGRVAQFGWGGVVYGLIDLLLLLIFVYVAFRFLNLDKLSKPKIEGNK
jgi:large-conductance mechanosensitive channel